MEVVPVPRAYTVLIDYAHSPNALENILLTAQTAAATADLSVRLRGRPG
ncbi:MAG: hypothetical protein V8S34_04380 [Lawsonibacter sp.]